jgi:hypothetical protein
VTDEGALEGRGRTSLPDCSRRWLKRG